MVVVDGRILVEGGRIVAFDTAPILAEARGLIRHLRERGKGLHHAVEQMVATLQ